MDIPPKDIDGIRRRLDAGSQPEPNSGCLLWTGYINRDGYGRLRVGRKKMLAHRVAWLLDHSIPSGMCVLHRCDVPSCINIRHLFLGTRDVNNKDMALKGRGTRSKRGFPYGVQPSGSRYMTHIKRDGISIYLGTYDTVDDAAAAVACFRATGARKTVMRSALPTTNKHPEPVSSPVGGRQI